MTGQGKPGFCKICTHPAAQFLNSRREREGEEFNAKQAQTFALTLDPDFKFARQTWYAHLEHITHPLVTAADQARQHPVVVPKTNTGVLEAIRDIGIRRAIDHPDEVTIDHALKAATELNRKQSGTDDVIVIFSKVMAGEATAAEIVGEWRELPAIETQEDTVGSK